MKKVKCEIEQTHNKKWVQEMGFRKYPLYDKE